MTRLHLGLRNNQTGFKPGEELQGVAGWQLDQAAQALEVRLFWHTQGKGTEDVQVMGVVRFDQPLLEEARPFRFRMPESPYSFSGKLISLMWALELVSLPSKESTRYELVMSPTGKEIVLHQP
jgi:hypothetical protein